MFVFLMETIPRDSIRRSQDLSQPDSLLEIQHQRQHLIDALIVEIDRKTDAIQKIGSDCVTLRTENKSHLKEIHRLRKKLEDTDLQTSRLINAFDIDILPLKEVQRRYALLSGKLESCVNKIKQLESTSKDYEEVKLNREELKKELKGLRDAHFAQQTLVLDLQETAKKGEKYKSVIIKQEQVIVELEKRIVEMEIGNRYQGQELGSMDFKRTSFVKESVVDIATIPLMKESIVVPILPIANNIGHAMPSDAISAPSVKEQTEIIKDQSIDSNSYVSSYDNINDHTKAETNKIWMVLLQENNALKTKIKQLENNSSSNGLEFKERAEIAETRCKALEMELIDSAKEFGNQIYQLQMANKYK
jgi:hypothetical protein